jgi:putative ABC transport system ATP-binding protein
MPEGRDAMLQADHLGRSIGPKVLVENVSFQVAAGQVLAITGPSGSGKTSLLRLLNRLDEPTAGTVYLEGADYRSVAPRDLRRKVGLVMQRPFLFPGTVSDNLRFGPAQRGKSISPETIDELLRQVGLEGYGSRTVTNLSGGEAQRVSFARTLANSPAVLLLDEPTSALDEDSRQEVESVIRKTVLDRKLACVLVTHDMSQAVRLAGAALVLEQGRVLRYGTVTEVLHAP